MMRSRKNWERTCAVICANQGSPEEYGFDELFFVRCNTRNSRIDFALTRSFQDVPHA